MSERPFTRVAVLVTAFKRTPSGRVRPVRGHFRNVRASGLAFRSDDLACPLAGSVEIDLDSLTTDAQARDENVIKHLFGAMRTVSVTVVPTGQILTLEGDDAWSWRGLVELSIGARVPIVLELRRRRVEDRVEVAARLSRALDTSITNLGFPFAAFLNAVGIASVIDRVEIDGGVVFDEQAARPRVRVVIAGAGIAGLAAAQTLIDAGCDVTILEKERFCGGKLTSHIDEELGHTVEHGIHGVFPAYRNLVDLWSEAGIGESIFADTDTVGIASPSGITSENFHDLSGQAPMFLREMIPHGLLRARDLAASATFLSRVYASSADRDVLDRETFQALLDRYGVSDRVQQFVMHPYVKNLSYARPDQVSAAASCDALGYYLLENADNFKARWLNGGPQELVIDPWVAELAKRGVRFLTSTPVKFVVFEDGLFRGFATRAVIPSRSLGTSERSWTQRFGTRVLALRWLPDQDRLSAWDGLCTHAGCPLQPAGVNGCDGFRCDCHGGAFDVEGRVLRAPPTRDLTSLPVVREEVSGEVFWKIALDESGDGDGVLSADYGIVALDIEGARSVLSTNLLDLPSTRGISALRTTPLMVLRMWFRGTGYTGPDSGFFQADDLLDNFFVLSRFQREFREVSGFTIVECHIGDCSGVDVREDDSVLRDAARCLERYFPELGTEALDIGRSRVLRHREGFTLFAPGDASRTPTVAADDRENLLFAGDWVQSDVRSWFMERAAVTGIEAANHVLARHGYAARTVRTAEQPDVLPKLLGLPFRAGDAIRQAYRAVVDGSDRAASTGAKARETKAREAQSREARAQTPTAPAVKPPAVKPPAAKPPAAKPPAAQPVAAKPDAVKPPIATAEEPKTARKSVERRSGTRLIAAERTFTPPLVDLADLLTTADLARVHPSVREFYEDPSSFDVVARLHMGSLVEKLVRGGLSISPLYALGLVAASDASQKEYPVRMHIREDDSGRLHWDRFLVIDGAEVPLFTGHVSVVDGCLRESLDGHGTPVTIDLRARADENGVRFDLARATPSWLFAPVRISYTTHATRDGIRTVGTYRHRLLRLDGRIEMEGTRRENEERATPHLDLVPPQAAASPVRLLPPTVPPPARVGRRGSGG